jgi:hypothetical protein
MWRDAAVTEIETDQIGIFGLRELWRSAGTEIAETR